jgi:hypothetical protein
MRRILLCGFTVLSLAGCFTPAYTEYRDPYGRPYRHEYYRNEDVYRLDDGRWYVRRHNDWVLRGDIVIR